MVRLVVGEISTGADVMVIGGGPGGYHAALRCARLGKDVVLVEAEGLGGVCLHAGCIPAKALARGPEPGQTLASLQEWKAGIVARLDRGVQQLLKQAEVTVVRGRARFTARDRVVVATAGVTESYRFRHCVIATGSQPATTPGFAVDGQRILDSTSAMALATVPEDLLVLGGGYIGLELGTAFARMGSRVTVVEALDRLLPGLDADLARAVHRRLKELGVTVHVSARALGWEGTGGPGGGAGGGAPSDAHAGQTGRVIEGMANVSRIQVRVAVDGQEQTFTPSHVLVATGRRPFTAGLGLDVAGVSLDEQGFIRVDAACRTSNPHIFAVGDVAGPPLLAHKAIREAGVAAAAVAGRPAAMDAVAIPAVVFTDPELASVGLTEVDAQARGLRPVAGRASFAASGRAWIKGSPNGFVKVVADADTGLLLGVHIAGPEASELIAAATLALELGARAEDVAMTVHPHPTLSETLMEAAAAAVEAMK